MELYIHTKGVRFPNSIFLRDWRNYMEHFLIRKGGICVKSSKILMHQGLILEVAGVIFKFLVDKK